MAVLLALAGCGGAGDSSAGSRSQIADLVERYESALQARDAETICREIWAPSFVDSEFGGALRCEGRVERLAQPGSPFVSAPTGHVVGLDVTNGSGTVDLSDGGFLDVVREGGRWYIRLES